MKREHSVIPLLVFLSLIALTLTLTVHPVYAEPTISEVLDHLGFTNVVKVENETFPPGTYEITLYAEFAAYCNGNELSYYEVGTNTYNLIFAGPEGGNGYIEPPLTKVFTINCEFGLSMLTPENHRYFTENSKNPDGQIHSVVYKNLDEPFMYLIGFENLYGAGDRDYQDMVFSIKLITPQQVIPQVPFGTILASTLMFAVFLGFVWNKRSK